MPGRRAFAWIGAALALPICAHVALERSVEGTLTSALESATGESVFIGDVDVSLLGALRIDDLTVGNIAEVGSVEARLSLAGLASGRLETAEVLVRAPHGDIQLEGERFRRLVSRLRTRSSAPSIQAEDRKSPAKKISHWPHIRVSGGELRVDAGERGTLVVHGFSVSPSTLGLRLVAESSELHTTFANRALTIELGRGAADFDLASGRLVRGIASGGELRLGDRVALSDVELSMGVDDGGAAKVLGRIGAGRVSVTRRGEHTELSLAGVAAKALNPFLTSSHFAAGRVSGNLGLENRGASRLGVTGSLLFHNVRGTVPWLFGRELDLSAEVAGAAEVSLESGFAIDIADLHIQRGPALARLHGSLRRPGSELESLTGTLNLELEPLTCSEMAAAMPVELVGPLRGLRLRGSLGGQASLSVGRSGSRPVELSVDLGAAGCRVLADAPHADVRSLRGSFEHLLPSGRRVVLSPGKKGYVSLQSLPAHVAAAFVVAEDGRFYRHKGFDERQIESSIAKDLAVGRFARGGSTISQQLAKNLYLTRERTFGRKLQEAVLAWRIEAMLSKRQILERYLNIIQLSDTIYGIDAAAKRWFGKSATRLSPREAAFLASLTRAPTWTTRAIGQQGGLTPRMVRRVEHILKSMRVVGAIDARTHQRARTSRLRLAPVVSVVKPKSPSGLGLAAK